METPKGESTADAVKAAVPKVAADFRSILTLFHRKAPKTHVVLVSVLPRGKEGQPNNDAFTSAIAVINEDLMYVVFTLVLYMVLFNVYWISD